MKLVVLLVALVACASTRPTPSAPAEPCPAVPVASAGTLEMKGYLLVLLRRGPAWTAEKTDETKRIFEGHMANIEAMARTGKLLIAGPIDAPAEDRTAIAGIFIFDAPRAEVEEMMKGDPAISIGRLVPEILTWYGPSGLTYPGQAAVLGTR